jgi:hypothetical protein
MVRCIGETDVWSPVAQHRDIARLCPQAWLEIIPGAGHFAPVEQAGTVARLLADWARSVIPADAGIDRIPDTPLFDLPRA